MQNLLLLICTCSPVCRHVSALFYQAPFLAFRTVHMEHHKHTNDEHRDP
jgi:fatty acid desaturase